MTQIKPENRDRKTLGNEGRKRRNGNSFCDSARFLEIPQSSIANQWLNHPTGAEDVSLELWDRSRESRKDWLIAHDRTFTMLFGISRRTQ